MLAPRRQTIDTSTKQASRGQSATQRAREQEVRAARMTVSEFLDALQAVCQEGFDVIIEVDQVEHRIDSIRFDDTKSNYSHEWRLN